MRSMVLPRAGGDDLTSGERLSRRAQALHLVEQLDQPASARTVKRVGLEVGNETPNLADRTPQLLEHDTSPGTWTL
jgi:hypothetical protein